MTKAQCAYDINIPSTHCGAYGDALSWDGSASCPDAIGYRLDVSFSSGPDYIQIFWGDTFEELLSETGFGVSFQDFPEGGDVYWDFYYDDGSGYTGFFFGYTHVDGYNDGEIQYICDGQAALFVHEGDYGVDTQTLTGTDYQTYWVANVYDHMLVVPEEAGEVQLSSPGIGYCEPIWYTAYFPVVDPLPVCDDALPMESGNLVSLEACGPITYGTGCSGVSDNGHRTPMWFVLNSGAESHVTFAAEETYHNLASSTYDEPYVEVFADGPDPGCDDLSLVACLSNQQFFEIDVADYAPVEANTDYYFVLHAVPSVQFDVVGVASPEAVTLTGCSDPASCNYVPGAVFEECPPLGCTNPVACNYSSSAVCDDGSCVIPTELEVLLYQDEDYDGNKDWWEDYVGGIGSVIIAQDDVPVFTVIPGADGQVVIPDMPDGSYTAYFYDSSGTWTDNGVVNFSFPRCDAINVGGYPTPDTFDHYSQFIGHTQTGLNCTSGDALWILAPEHRL